MEARRSSKFSDYEKSGYEAMMYLTWEKQRAQNPSLDRQSLPSSKPEIKVGYFYELDLSKLSPKFPEQLYSIKIVMVNDKTSQSVSLRFPSVHSLRTHFSEESYAESGVRKFPALDEKYVMASDMAAKALHRRIPSQEMDERGKFWSFWSPPSQSSEANESADVASKKGSCWSQLRFNGLVQWGKRRQVRFLNRHEEFNCDMAFEGTSTVHVDDEEKKEEEHDKDDDDEEEDVEDDGDDDNDDGDDKEEEEKVVDDVEFVKEEEEEEEHEIVEDVMTRHSRNNKKRKIPSNSKSNASKAESSKKAKRSCQSQNQTVTNTQSSNKKKLLRNSIDRWSAARYKLAEENMLKIMKAKGAFFGNPILRPALRAEARKLIGDTGLLDHLLKHMAGKLAPGGADRFRRRHNSDGAMEYWIENADLVNIRRQAGVQDPYWTPPPGWKPGDNPLQDPISAREIESLKKEITKLKKNVQELVSKREEEVGFSAGEMKRIKEEIAKMRRDMEELFSKRPKQDLAMGINPNTMLTSVQCDNDNGSFGKLKKMYMELMQRKSMIEEQLMEFSESLSSMEEYSRLMKSELMSELEEPSQAPLMRFSSQCSEITREIKKTKGQRTKPSTTRATTNKSAQDQKRTNKVSEDKATKIQRLKSGFRICKPQGSFLWPNMVTFSDPQAVLHDPLVVPTPPSVSSTSAPPGSHVILRIPQVPPSSPVKPLAEKRPIKPTTLLTVSKETSSSSIPPPPATPSSRTINIFNLNEAPYDQTTADVTAMSSDEKEKEVEGKGNLVKN